jgi:hypothetical protein
MKPLQNLYEFCVFVGAKLSEEDIALDEAAEEAAVLQPHNTEISTEDSSMEVSSDEGNAYTIRLLHLQSTDRFACNSSISAMLYCITV